MGIQDHLVVREYLVAILRDRPDFVDINFENTPSRISPIGARLMYSREEEGKRVEYCIYIRASLLGSSLNKQYREQIERDQKDGRFPVMLFANNHYPTGHVEPRNCNEFRVPKETNPNAIYLLSPLELYATELGPLNIFDLKSGNILVLNHNLVEGFFLHGLQKRSIDSLGELMLAETLEGFDLKRDLETHTARFVPAPSLDVVLGPISKPEEPSPVIPFLSSGRDPRVRQHPNAPLPPRLQALMDQIEGGVDVALGPQEIEDLGRLGFSIPDMDGDC
jgi:hypothetical protein